MYRRRALEVLGTSAASLAVLGSVPSTGDAADDGDGPQPVGGELPNENVPNAIVNAFPSPDPPATRETGTFLTLSNGWVGGNLEDLLDSTRQTFEYDGQTFVLDSFDDWVAYETQPGKFLFTHTDPPKPAGKTFEVTWDVIVTESYFDELRDEQYEPGDRYLPSLFPLGDTFEVVPRSGGNG